jgi:hypothetical protein
MQLNPYDGIFAGTAKHVRVIDMVQKFQRAMLLHLQQLTTMFRVLLCGCYSEHPIGLYPPFHKI